MAAAIVIRYRITAASRHPRPTVVIPSEARDLLSAFMPDNTGIAVFYGADVA